MKKECLLIAIIIALVFNMAFMCTTANGMDDVDGSFSEPRLSDSSEWSDCEESFSISVRHSEGADSKLLALNSFNSVKKKLNDYHFKLIFNWRQADLIQRFKILPNSDPGSRFFSWYPKLTEADEQKLNKDLDIIFSFLFEEVIRFNEVMGIRCGYNSYNAFLRKPINLVMYVERMRKYMTRVSGTNIASLVYMDELLLAKKDGGLCLSSENVYLIFGLSQLFANRFYDDSFFSASVSASVLGVSPDLLSFYYRCFYLDVKFNFVIAEEVYKSYCEKLFDLANLCETFSIETPEELEELFIGL